MSGGVPSTLSQDDSTLNTPAFPEDTLPPLNALQSQSTLPSSQNALSAKSMLAKTLLKEVDSIDDGFGGPERRKLKNEDSSYDSDFEPVVESFVEKSQQQKPHQQQYHHDDVTRTVSETLAAEFEDYVTPHQNPGSILPCNFRSSNILPGRHASVSLSRTNSGHLITKTNLHHEGVILEDSTTPVLPLSSVLESEEYAQQVDFGVKLGYSESLVQLALSKLGLNPDKNELLDELIRLGAGAPRSEGEEGTFEAIEELDQATTHNTLRPVIIDGSNVAMSHGNKVRFSCKGIRLCVDWFRARGHKEVLVFVPMWRKELSRADSVVTDRDELQELEKEGVLSFTPSRSCGGKRIISYDDRYIIKEALKSDGVIVSNDNYRDLQNESPAFRKVIETSLLMYSWVNGRFEPPDDPLGRNGPSLDTFLRKQPLGSSIQAASKDSRPCPYGRKCTYGNKCKYIHPERGTAPMKSVTEILQEQKQKHYQDKAKSRDSSPGENLRAKSLSLPISACDSSGVKKPLARTQSGFPAVGTNPNNGGPDFIVGVKSNLVVSSESKISPSQTPLPINPSFNLERNHGSFESLCGSILKDDLSLFSLCPQIGFSSSTPNVPWPNQDLQSAKSAQNISMPFEPRVGENMDGLSIENLHPKLQRQLSLNPVGDDRLNKLSTHMINNPSSSDFNNLMSSFALQPNQQQLRHQQMMQSPSSQQTSIRLLESSDGMPSRTNMGTRCISPGPTFSGNNMIMQPYYHPPLTRHSSAQEGMRPFPQQMLPPSFHNPVGRNLSAPDHLRGGIGQQQPKSIIPHITRLNSTSDSNLNMHIGNDPQQFASDCFEDSTRLRLPYSKLSGGAAVPFGRPNSPGPVGSRPISPQQNVTLNQKHSTQSQAPSSQLQAPPPSQLQAPSSSIGRQHIPSQGSASHEDERLKIFYHLSQLFPEAQVRRALAQNPEETDPTKICMSILSMSGLRPQLMKSNNSQLPNFGANNAGGSLTLGSFPSSQQSFPVSPSFSSTSTSPRDTNREAARLEAYSKLSKLFSDEQVRNVLMRYPDETDATKLCMYVMALNCQA